MDLKFPHHEMRDARPLQLPQKSGQYWLHSNMLTVNGQKMSKSLGNSFLRANYCRQPPAFDPVMVHDGGAFFMLQSIIPVRWIFPTSLECGRKRIQTAGNALVTVKNSNIPAAGPQPPN